MVAAETTDWVIVILKMVFAILGCAFVVLKVTPKSRNLFPNAVEGLKSVGAFIFILNTFIIFYTAKLLLTFLSPLYRYDYDAMPYIITIKPAFDVVLGFYNYIPWILVAVVFVVAFDYLSNKN